MRAVLDAWPIVILAVVGPVIAQDPISSPKPGSNNAGNVGLLVIDTSERCRIEIDGRPFGELDPGDMKIVPLRTGKHKILGVALNGGAKAGQEVEIAASRQEALLLKFGGVAPESQVRTNQRDGQKYALIPHGDFRMGCAPTDTNCAADEKPAHDVTITRDFWIGITEFTRGGWRRVCAMSGSGCPAQPFPDEKEDDKLPVANVSWREADTVCRLVGRLPTEAEWEYAARGGQEELRYPSGNDITHADANYSGVSGRDRWQIVAPVGEFPANPWGLFDMAGNLWEWCADSYSATWYESSPESDPVASAAGEMRLARGGSWNNASLRLRVSARNAMDPETRLPTIGFRCLVEAIQ